MLKTLLKLAIFLVIVIVGYNYFFGDEAEQAQSREMVGKAKNLGADAWSLLISEKQKLDDGKYDDALDKLDNLYGDLRERAQKIQDSGALDRLEELTERRGELEEMLLRGDELSTEGKRKLDNLTSDTEALMHEMEAQSQSTAPR